MPKLLIATRTGAVLAGALCLAASLGSCGHDSPPDHNSEPRRYIYEYGQKVRFGYGGDSLRFRLSGWSHTEPTFTWTDGPAASLAFRVPASASSVTLKMRLAGWTKPPELPFQPVDVYVNAKKIGAWKVAQENFYSMIIPREFVAGPEDEHQGGGTGETPLGFTNAGKTTLLIIDFHLPLALSPFDLNFSWDTRRLGIRCHELQINKAPLQAAADAAAAAAAASAAEENRLNNLDEEPAGNFYTLGTILALKAGGGVERYMVSGWYTPEEKFTWTSNQPAVLAFEIPQPTGPLTLKMRLAGLIKPGSLPTQPTEVLVNGQKVADWQVGSLAEFSAVIPGDIVSQGEMLRVELHAPNAVAPKAIGLSGDVRILGVRCEALVISE